MLVKRVGQVRSLFAKKDIYALHDPVIEVSFHLGHYCHKWLAITFLVHGTFFCLTTFDNCQRSPSQTNLMLNLFRLNLSAILQHIIPTSYFKDEQSLVSLEPFLLGFTYYFG